MLSLGDRANSPSGGVNALGPLIAGPEAYDSANPDGPRWDRPRNPPAPTCSGSCQGNLQRLLAAVEAETTQPADLVSVFDYGVRISKSGAVWAK